MKNKSLSNIPPCLLYGGQSLESQFSQAQKDKGTYKGLSHLRTAYELYRYFDCPCETPTAFIKTYKEWYESSSKIFKTYFRSIDDFDDDVKRVISEYEKKEIKRKERGKASTCLSIANSHMIRCKVCRICPMSNEYVNDRLELENIVLGYSLKNSDYRFLDIAVKGLIQSIYIGLTYEDICSHITGSYAIYRLDEHGNKIWSTYNFNGLLAYFISRYSETLLAKGGTVRAEIDKRIYDAGALANYLLNLLRVEAGSLALHGTGAKSNLYADYSLTGLSTEDMEKHFFRAIQSIVNAANSATEEDYNNAIDVLRNVYTYNDYNSSASFTAQSDLYVGSLNRAPSGVKKLVDAPFPFMQFSNPNNDKVGNTSSEKGTDTSNKRNDWSELLKKCGLSGTPIESTDTSKKRKNASDKRNSPNKKEVHKHPDDVAVGTETNPDEPLTVLEPIASPEEKSATCADKKDITSNAAIELNNTNVHLSLIQNDTEMNVLNENGDVSDESVVSNTMDVKEIATPEPEKNDELTTINTEIYESSQEDDEEDIDLFSLENILCSDEDNDDDECGLLDLENLTNVETDINHTESIQSEIYAMDIQIDNDAYDNYEQVDESCLDSFHGYDNTEFTDNIDNEVPLSMTETTPETNSSSLKQDEITDFNSGTISVNQMSLIPIDKDPAYSDVRTFFGLNDLQMNASIAECTADLGGYETIAVECMYHSEFNMYGILIFIPSKHKYWYINDICPGFSTVCWHLFISERPKLCMNFPMLNALLSKNNIRKKSLFSLTPLYAAIHPEIKEITISNIIGCNIEKGTSVIESTLPLYEMCYGKMNVIMASDDSMEIDERFEHNNLIDQILSFSADVSHFINISGPVAYTNDYTDIKFKYDKSKLLSDVGYSLLSLTCDLSFFKNQEQMNNFFNEILRTLALSSCYIRYGISLLNIDNSTICFACIEKNMNTVNDLVISHAKDAYKKVSDDFEVPEFYIDSQVL
ncbi:MAG: hypothetical protein PHW47_10490 [Lachnospira sp.]|nr:hypothetical protein [Lachnospira sp.]